MVELYGIKCFKKHEEIADLKSNDSVLVFVEAVKYRFVSEFLIQDHHEAHLDFIMFDLIRSETLPDDFDNGEEYTLIAHIAYWDLNGMLEIVTMMVEYTNGNSMWQPLWSW